MRWVGVIVATILLLVVSTAKAAQEEGRGVAKAGERAATGIVTAVTPASRTLVVESRLGGKPWILGVVVPRDLAIGAGGKTKKLEDLKAGDRVRIRWIRKDNELVAESVGLAGAKAP
ncbi:MAG: hypothetical protein HY712_05735 [candidate division NC10 bacterium]|nr:hypothetical protein [candidate division NC10 bacterium]